ncbi:cyclase/dehydrase [Planomonospora sphaerica]|uniref:Cyclase/dehydrase n=1 Tax=Planomonospora sphaerica TaxID=161355 RepID=A0A161LPR4_9ACTN|nr:SRPBCC domain-containing protein [Planomonospora sphaerica]GAT70165.1 cyclase/dehydrase [Planomonospora sphaerica]
MLAWILTPLAVLLVVPAALYAWTRLRPHAVRTEIEIAVSPERVWRVLTDFAAYPEWNPFIVSAEGEPRAGATLTNRLSNNGGTMTFSPTVLAAVPARELRWIGRFVMPGVVDGEHYFVIEDLGGGRTRLVHGETFTGALVPFAGGALDVEGGFAAMNAALKARAEQAA